MNNEPNAMRVALGVGERGPDLIGPTAQQMLVIGGYAREIAERNRAILALASEAQMLLDLTHNAHGGSHSLEHCLHETCRRVASVISEARRTAEATAAIQIGS